jgi:hypothetical protein
MHSRSVFSFGYFFCLISRYSWFKFLQFFEATGRRWIYLLTPLIGPFIQAALNDFRDIAAMSLKDILILLAGPVGTGLVIYLYFFFTAPYALAKKQRRRIKNMHAKMMRYVVRRISVTFDPTVEKYTSYEEEGLWAGRKEIKKYAVRIKNECYEDIVSIRVHCDNLTVAESSEDSYCILTRTGDDSWGILTRGEELHRNIVENNRTYAKEGQLIRSDWTVLIPSKGNSTAKDGKVFRVNIVITASRMRPVTVACEFGERADESVYFKLM